MKHARAIAAVATPTVNSYKRLTPRLRDGEISWAPIWAAYGDNNRSCMLRLPAQPPGDREPRRRLGGQHLPRHRADARGRPGGHREEPRPGRAGRSQTYDWQAAAAHGATRLPRTLLEAIDAFEDDPLVHEVFAPQFVTEYAEMKNEEWDDYHAQVTDWERDALPAQPVSSRSIAEVTRSSSGVTSGEKRATTAPSRDNRNFSKFQRTSGSSVVGRP